MTNGPASSARAGARASRQNSARSQPRPGAAAPLAPAKPNGPEGRAKTGVLACRHRNDLSRAFQAVTLRRAARSPFAGTKRTRGKLIQTMDCPLAAASIACGRGPDVTMRISRAGGKVEARVLPLPAAFLSRRRARSLPRLAPQPRMRSRRSRSLTTRQWPPPDSTLRCQSSSRVMYSRGSTLSERSLVTLIAITSKPSTVSGRLRT